MSGPSTSPLSDSFRRSWVRTTSYLYLGLGLVLSALALTGVEEAISAPGVFAWTWTIGLVSLYLLRQRHLNQALLLQSFGLIGAIGWLHHTVPSSDTGTYYALPQMAVMVLLANRYSPTAIVVSTIALLLGIRLFPAEPDPYWMSHSLNVVVVFGTTGYLTHRLRQGWEDDRASRERVLVELALSEAEQRDLWEQAVQADQAKSRFLANMSHELRTPLNAVLGYAELLEESSEDEDFQADAARIQAAGQHLLGIVDDILDLARVESGGRTPEATSFQLDALASELGEWLAPQVRSQRNTLTIDLPTITLLSDRLMLRQVLLNLLANSNKFTQGGALRLGAAVDGPDVVFLMQDEGIGMTADEMSRVWEPFQQANADVAKTFGGTGLGLTLVQRFCRALGGSVSLASAKGEGTIVTARIPIHLPEVRRTPAPGGSRDGEDPSGPRAMA